MAPLIECDEPERQSELVARIEEGLGNAGPAAVGLDEVVEEAASQAAQVVVVVRDHREWLRNLGGIAALLRW